MKSEPAGRCRKRIEDLRVPAVNGLPDDVYHMLHDSFVDIARMRRRMRRRIESADALIDSPQKLFLNRGKCWNASGEGISNTRGIARGLSGLFSVTGASIGKRPADLGQRSVANLHRDWRPLLLAPNCDA